MEFQGFSPETFDFLWGIRMNNSREWFLPHKQDYVNYLYEPMKALGQGLFPVVADTPGTVLKVSRIYRDARLHHPLPYKESLWLCIRPDGAWWAENPCLYFELRPEGASYGFSVWRPRPALMEAFRRDLAANSAPFFAALEALERKSGMKVTAERYKKPQPCGDARLAPYFAWRQDIGCTVSVEPGEALFTPALQTRVAELFAAAMPLYRYFAALASRCYGPAAQ